MKDSGSKSWSSLSVALREKLDDLEAAAAATNPTEDNANARLWESVWHTPTITTKLEGINGLGIRIKEFVFPIFAVTQQKMEVKLTVAM